MYATNVEGTRNVIEAASAAGPTYDIDVESFANRSRAQYYMDFFQGPARHRSTIRPGAPQRDGAVS